MWIVYILKSSKSNKHYTGFTSNLNKRIEWHNKGFTKSTKFGAPWKLVYKERFDAKTKAISREKQIKSYKGGLAFKKLLGGVA
jgi:putative endonuclease